MVKSTIKFTFIILSCMLILACNPAKQVDLEVQVKVTLDGKPASQARVMLDGNEVGSTDTDGRFNQRLKKQPGEEVRVSVLKNAEGYRITPWENTFVTKLPKAGAVETYAFDVDRRRRRVSARVYAYAQKGAQGSSRQKRLWRLEEVGACQTGTTL